MNITLSADEELIAGQIYCGVKMTNPLAEA